MDAYLKGQEVRLERERLETERRIQQERLAMEQRAEDARLELMRAEVARVKAETERIKRVTQGSQTHTTEQVRSGSVEADLESGLQEAVAEIRADHPEIDRYSQDMIKLVDCFALGDRKAISLRQYLEGLYVIARFTAIAKGLI